MFLKILIAVLLTCVEIQTATSKGAGVKANGGASVSRHPPVARVKKSGIATINFRPANLTNTENATKRGFLANLASLLNDAELMSKKDSEPGDVRTGAAMSSIAHKDDSKHVSPSEGGQISGNISLADSGGPSVVQVEHSLITEGKRFAPIFAYFHGKIVPLGRLPATSFHKSHEDEIPDAETASQIPDAKEPMTIPRPEVPTQATSSTKSEVEKAPPASIEDIKKTTTEPIVPSKPSTNVVKVSDKPTETEAVAKSLRVLSPMKYERLSKFFKTLEEQSKPSKQTRTLKTTNVAGVTKDEVTFPEENPSVRTNDVMTHVKALLLDNGKVLHIPEKGPVNNPQPVMQENPKVKSSDTEGNPEDPNERYFVAEDGSLTPMFKAKEAETEQASARDMSETEKPSGDKTITLSVDMLKDLLKKADNKVSLAQLLNEKTKTEAKPETQEEDPGTIEDFAAGGLKKHNEFRGEHHSPALVWSDDLANEAQKLAEELADKKALEISKDLEKKGYGENVAKVWANFKCAGEAATKMWYTQSANYKYFDPQLDENTGQFAQVVWKDTKELGMGVAKSIDDVNNKYVYVVALYRPPGNIEATLRDNVIPKGNNTVDVYSTFFKRSGKLPKKRSVKVASLKST